GWEGCVRVLNPVIAGRNEGMETQPGLSRAQASERTGWHPSGRGVGVRASVPRAPMKRHLLGIPAATDRMNLQMTPPAEPLVFLVGAGPGNPGLLTLRAVECLAQADVIIYDKLVPIRLLDHANPGAERICVNELPGQHPDRWPHIHNALIDAAKQGKRVV